MGREEERRQQLTNRLRRSGGGTACSSTRLAVMALLVAVTTVSAFVRVPAGAGLERRWIGGGGGAAGPSEGPSPSVMRPRSLSGVGVVLAAEGGSGSSSSSSSNKKGSKPPAGGGGGGGANKQRRRQDHFEGMKMGQRFEMGYDIEPEVVPLEEDDTLPWVETIAAAADARKGEDLYAIRVSSLTTVSSFFVLVSGNSRPQIQAIAGAIEEDMQEKHGVEPRNGGEGTADSGWILLDYGCVVVNIMTPVARQYYALEKLWRKGEEVDLSHILMPNAPPGSDVGGSVPIVGKEGPDEREEDPFWS